MLTTPLRNSSSNSAIFEAFHCCARIAEVEVGVETRTRSRAARRAASTHADREICRRCPRGRAECRSRAPADQAGPPKAVPLHHPHKLLDFARIAPKDQRRKVVDHAYDRASLPFEVAFVPVEQSALIGADPHEDPVSHLRKDSQGPHARDLRLILPPVPQTLYRGSLNATSAQHDAVRTENSRNF